MSSDLAGLPASMRALRLTQFGTPTAALVTARVPRPTVGGHSQKERLVGDGLGEPRTTALRDRDSVRVGPVNTPSAHADSFTPQELAAWRGLREVHARVIHQLDIQMQAAHGLTLSQSEVLILLYDAPGQRMRMTELAEAVPLSRSACTRTADRLVTLGYVTRRAATDDRRGRHAQLTDTGRQVITPARATHREGVRADFLDRLRATDQVALGDIWARFRAGAFPRSDSTGNTEPHRLPIPARA
jgi:DNA-binding MarR family transcriptional regulator